MPFRGYHSIHSIDRSGGVGGDSSDILMDEFRNSDVHSVVGCSVDGIHWG